MGVAERVSGGGEHQRRRTEAGRSRRRELLVGGAHLSGLSGLAFAQPLYDLLQGDLSALVATDVTGFALVLLVAGIALGPPLALVCVEALALAIHRGLARVVHLAFVGGLVALFVLQAHTVVALPEGLLVALAAICGVLGAEVYRRSRNVRFGLSVLAPAPVLFAALFLVSPAVSPLLHPSQPRVSPVGGVSRAPVVLVVLDELPLPSLLDRRARIDGARYPAFARFARGATWFPNTTSVDASTSSAVPAILTGNQPQSDLLPTSSEHPRSIFTLLSGGHDLHVVEPLTRICPERLCERERPGAPKRALVAGNLLTSSFASRLLPQHLAEGALRVTRGVQGLVGADTSGDYLAATVERRRADFERFVDSIREERRPGLYVLHLLLPHGPWEYLPSGRRYESELHGLVDDRWVDDPDLVAQGWQRHLLQLQFTDRLFGTLLHKLEREGLYDQVLIAVVADHGVNFAVNGQRRKLDRQSVRQLAPVLFMVKAPGQRRGEVRDVPLETVDVLPTIADRLGIRLPLATDGASAFRPDRPRQRLARMSEAGEGRFTVPRALLTRGGETLARRLALFGSGRDQRRLFTLGAWAALVGRQLRERTLGADPTGRARLVDAERFENVRPSAARIPAEVEGTIEGPASRARRDLAIAVNGRIGAVTRSFYTEGAERFAAVLPDWALRPGANDVTVLTVRRGARGLLLTPLSAAR